MRTRAKRPEVLAKHGGSEQRRDGATPSGSLGGGEGKDAFVGRRVGAQAQLQGRAEATDAAREAVARAGSGGQHATKQSGHTGIHVRDPIAATHRHIERRIATEAAGRADEAAVYATIADIDGVAVGVGASGVEAIEAGDG